MRDETFEADAVYEWTANNGERVQTPIKFLKPGEKISQMNRPIKTTDSADGIEDRLIELTATLEKLVHRLENGSGRRRVRTVDSRPRVRVVDAAQDFVQAARRFHRQGFNAHPERPRCTATYRTVDADESPAEEFERNARKLRERMLGRSK